MTLPNLRIIDYVIGHCGSAHDSTVFRDSQTYKCSSTLFNENEWIWADSAYALNSWCVTPYRKPLSALAENKVFNYHLSRVRFLFIHPEMPPTTSRQVRVKSEHAMGYIKGRFCSLRGLRQQINNPQDHECTLIWVKTCIIIHTLVSIIEHGDEDGSFIAELVQEGTDANRSTVGSDDGVASDIHREGGQLKRTGLKNSLLEHLDMYSI